MAENANNLLIVFEDCIRDLMKLCDDREKRIRELETDLKNREAEIQQANKSIEELQSKYNYLLVARRLEVNGTEYQNARKQVDRLVREVETCITLLKKS